MPTTVEAGLTLGINYSLGHLYLDRCGQCFNDVEETCEGWHSVGANPQSGQIENPDKNFSIEFNDFFYRFSARKAFNKSINNIATEANTIWKIIKANLGLKDFWRIGCHPVYMLATKSIEEAEKRLHKADLQVSLPENISNSEYHKRTQHIIVNLLKETIEYRIDFGCIIQQEAINPQGILKGDSRYFSKKQREFFLAQQKQLAEYSVNPMYAIRLDIDCFEMNPKTINAEEFIINQMKVVEKDFLYILEKV
jgi:hypothetical protein